MTVTEFSQTLHVEPVTKGPLIAHISLVHLENHKIGFFPWNLAQASLSKVSFMTVTEFSQTLHVEPVTKGPLIAHISLVQLENHKIGFSPWNLAPESLPIWGCFEVKRKCGSKANDAS